MRLSFDLGRNLLVSTAFMAGLSALGVEQYARGEGAGAVPTPGRHTRVIFHRVPVFVTSGEALIYYGAVALFLGCWAVGIAWTLSRKLVKSDRAQ